MLYNRGRLGVYKNSVASISVKDAENDRSFILSINIDSCERVGLGTPVGPLFAARRQINIGDIVYKLYSMKLEEAVGLVIDDVRRGREALVGLLSSVDPQHSAQGLNVSDELEADPEECYHQGCQRRRLQSSWRDCVVDCSEYYSPAH